MDAIHFRLQAAHAREMAMSGEDLRLTRMLLEVARELDAEADAMEAEAPAVPPAAANASTAIAAQLHAAGGNRNTVSAGMFDLTIFGASTRGDSIAARASTSQTTVQDFARHLEDTVGQH